MFAQTNNSEKKDQQQPHENDNSILEKPLGENMEDKKEKWWGRKKASLK